MTTPHQARAVLDRDYLGLRGKLLELAAGLDRIERAGGATTDDDPRYKALCEAATLLVGSGGDRAERIQRALSLPYDENWRERYGVG